MLGFESESNFSAEALLWLYRQSCPAKNRKLKYRILAKDGISTAQRALLFGRCWFWAKCLNEAGVVVAGDVCLGIVQIPLTLLVRIKYTLRINNTLYFLKQVDHVSAIHRL